MGATVDKITITGDDLARASVVDPLPRETSKRLIPVWLRGVTFLLIVFPPVLYVLTLAVLPTIRKRPLALKHAWAVHLCCLLVASGFLWLAVALTVVISGPPPDAPEESSTLTLSIFPSLPSSTPFSAKEVAQQLRPLVLVVRSPMWRLPFSRSPVFGSRIGAAAVVHADANGYLAVTSRHVVQPSSRQCTIGDLVTVADENGTLFSGRLVGRHRELDLALLWIKRSVSTDVYTQPIRSFSAIDLGDNIFAIGHPEGLDFSISTGIISQKRGGDLLQISAPTSPGSSGGPVFDEHGVLLGIVQSVIDKEASPNAENLNFAVRADALLDSTGWDLDAQGEEALAALRRGVNAAASPKGEASGRPEISTE